MKSFSPNQEDIEKLFSGEVDRELDGFAFLAQEGVVDRVVGFLKECPDWKKNNFLNLYGTCTQALSCEKALAILECFSPFDPLWGRRNTSLIFQYLTFLIEENKACDLDAVLEHPVLKKTASLIVDENILLFKKHALTRDALGSWKFLSHREEGAKRMVCVWSEALSLKSYTILEHLMQGPDLAPSERVALVVAFCGEGANNKDMRKFLTFLCLGVSPQDIVLRTQGRTFHLECMYELVDNKTKEELITLLTKHPSVWQTLMSRESELGKECLRRDLQMHVCLKKPNRKQHLGKKM